MKSIAITRILYHVIKEFINSDEYSKYLLLGVNEFFYEKDCTHKLNDIFTVYSIKFNFDISLLKSIIINYEDIYFILNNCIPDKCIYIECDIGFYSSLEIDYKINYYFNIVSHNVLSDNIAHIDSKVYLKTDLSGYKGEFTIPSYIDYYKYKECLDANIKNVHPVGYLQESLVLFDMNNLNGLIEVYNREPFLLDLGISSDFILELLLKSSDIDIVYKKLSKGLNMNNRKFNGQMTLSLVFLDNVCSLKEFVPILNSLNKYFDCIKCVLSVDIVYYCRNGQWYKR